MFQIAKLSYLSAAEKRKDKKYGSSGNKLIKEQIMLLIFFCFEYYSIYNYVQISHTRSR